MITDQSEDFAVLTVQETAKYLRLNRNSVYEASKRGDLPIAIRVGRRLLIPRAALERFLSSTSKGNPAPMTPLHRQIAEPDVAPEPTA